MTEMEMLRKVGTIVHFKKDQVVFSQYDSGNEMFVVLKGTFGVFINTFTGFPNRVAGIKQGSFFGEMSVIDGSPRSATITAEEESNVIAIKKENFGKLLTKAPDIATGIMETMRNRVTTTAEAVRNAGKEAPDLPPILKIVQYKDAEKSIAFLVLLSEKIRQMNELLMAASDDEQAKQMLEKTMSGNVVKLLPENYTKYNITDNNNNKDNMRVAAVVCPYCLKSINAYVPLFSSFIKSSETPDGRIIYSNFNILLYTNIVCPNCCYTDTYLEFSKPRHPSSEPCHNGNQFANEEGFTGYAETQNRTIDEAVLSYYQNIECLKRTTDSPLKLANAWIRLHWLYSDQKSAELSKTAAANALLYYKKYAEKNASIITEDDKLRLNAILGEMCVVLGDYENALKHYKDNLKVSKNSKNKLLLESKKRISELKKG